MNSNKIEMSVKVSHRTHHRRFFEKLYGNLENSSNEKKEVHSALQEEVVRYEAVTSPSGSSGSSSEMYSSEISPRNSFVSTQTDLRLNSFSPSLLPSHYGGLRLPMGFTSDPHNHFAAFLARRRRKEGRQRRQRTTFSSDQTLRLEVEFNRNEYISRGRRFELAENLHLSETQIKIWFQNRRAKDKRIEKAQIDQHYRNFAAASGLLPFGMSYPQQPFMPTALPNSTSTHASTYSNQKYNSSKIESSQ